LKKPDSTASRAFFDRADFKLQDSKGSDMVTNEVREVKE